MASPSANLLARTAMSHQRLLALRLGGTSRLQPSPLIRSLSTSTARRNQPPLTKAAATVASEAPKTTAKVTTQAAKVAPETTAKAVAAAAPSPTVAVADATRKAGKAGSSAFSKVITYTLFILGGTYLVTYYLDSRSAIHRWVAMPFLHTFVDAEEGQKLAIQLLKSGLAPKDYTGDDELLATELFGQPLVNPLGLAAGFDKQAEAIDGLFDLGFGIVEIGSVTPEPQPGNPKPRYFRLPSHSACINRFGFNSDGHAAVEERLLHRVRDYLILHPRLIPAEFLADPTKPDADPRLSQHDAIVQAASRVAEDTAVVARLLDQIELPRSLRAGRLLSVNLGKNKTSAESDPSDFVKGVQRLGPLADMLVVNVSSPNTPGLRDLQKREALENLLKAVAEARDALPTRKTKSSSDEESKERKVPLVVKLSPDLSSSELDDAAATILSSGIDGVIISNTTTQRPASLAAALPQSELSTLQETGGLSGPPLRAFSRQALQQVVGRLREGGVEVIAAGGISTPEDVLEATHDGASAIQVYTSFGWQGVGMVSRWKEELRAMIRQSRENEGQAQHSNTYRLLAHDAKSNLAQREKERKEAQRLALTKGSSEVRHELDELKKSLGGGKGDSDSKKQQSQSSNDDDIFFPEQGDDVYNDLLSSARRALEIKEPTRPLVSEEARQKEADLTKEIIRQRQAMASINPLDAAEAPPTLILQAAGGTNHPRDSRVEEKDQVKVVGSEQVEVEPLSEMTGVSSQGSGSGKGKSGKASLPSLRGSSTASNLASEARGLGYSAVDKARRV